MTEPLEDGRLQFLLQPINVDQVRYSSSYDIFLKGIGITIDACFATGPYCCPLRYPWRTFFTMIIVIFLSRNGCKKTHTSHSRLQVTALRRPLTCFVLQTVGDFASVPSIPLLLVDLTVPRWHTPRCTQNLLWMTSCGNPSQPTPFLCAHLIPCVNTTFS